MDTLIKEHHPHPLAAHLRTIVTDGALFTDRQTIVVALKNMTEKELAALSGPVKAGVLFFPDSLEIIVLLRFPDTTLEFDLPIDMSLWKDRYDQPEGLDSRYLIQLQIVDSAKDYQVEKLRLVSMPPALTQKLYDVSLLQLTKAKGRRIKQIHATRSLDDLIKSCDQWFVLGP